MSYDSASLTTPDIRWLGLRPSDLNRCVRNREGARAAAPSQTADGIRTHAHPRPPPPRQVRSPRAVPVEDDGQRYQDRQGAAPGILHHEEPPVDEGAPDHGACPRVAFVVHRTPCPSVDALTARRPLPPPCRRSRRRRRPRSRPSRPSASSTSRRNTSPASECHGVAPAIPVSASAHSPRVPFRRRRLREGDWI